MYYNAEVIPNLMNFQPVLEPRPQSLFLYAFIGFMLLFPHTHITVLEGSRQEPEIVAIFLTLNHS